MYVCTRSPVVLSNSNPRSLSLVRLRATRPVSPMSCVQTYAAHWEVIRTSVQLPRHILRVISDSLSMEDAVMGNFGFLRVLTIALRRALNHSLLPGRTTVTL